MQANKKNPPQNVLAPSTTEEQLLDAVDQSGYPLQTRVARTYTSVFNTLDEEWSYIDRDTNQLRALDLLAMKDADAVPAGDTVWPALALLTECKHSEMPYVFFESAVGNGFFGQPLLAGLRSDAITIRALDTNHEFIMPAQQALSLDFSAFISKPVPEAATYGKAVRQGSKLELSGSEPYNAAVLPLIKAAAHFKATHAPTAEATGFECYGLFLLCVLDAPMIVASTAADPQDRLRYEPWIRVSRQEAASALGGRVGDTQFMIDFVHEGFLAAYLLELISTFFEPFCDVVSRHHLELSTGHGVIDSEDLRFFINGERNIRPETNQA